MELIDEWNILYPNSMRLHQAASEVLPGGLTHDSRFTIPFPIYIDRAEGSKKWDVDGNEYVDYWMGHGSLILGHGFPAVVDAVWKQLVLGTHFGACHELEVEWARLVHELVPCADLVRFCASGTEATLLAIRLARAFTGRSRVLRFFDHFHGWHDYAMCGFRPPYDSSASPGVPTATCASVVSRSDADRDAVAAVLLEEDVAAAILEPTGASFGTIPLDRDFVADLRELTEQTGTLLIVDEVVSGFRLAPGGAQESLGVRPDMCTLGKALGGGLPGAAVAGRGDILSLLSPTGTNGVKVPHQGTFNASPTSAAAGVAALQMLRSGHPQEKASETAELLRRECNDVFSDLGLAGGAYGIGSLFHVHVGEGIELNDDGTIRSFDRSLLADDLRTSAKTAALRSGMLKEGVDLMRTGGMVSATHTKEDISATTHALRLALQNMMSLALI